MVNAHIISAILVLILLANLFVSVVRPLKRLPYYLLLLGAAIFLLPIFNRHGLEPIFYSVEIKTVSRKKLLHSEASFTT